MHRNQIHRSLLPLTLAAALLPFGFATANPAVWAVTGGKNTVYLFGSVHLLPRGAFEITGELERAYRRARRVCLEVDIGALTPEATASITLARAIDTESHGLYDLLGASAPRVREAAAAAGFDLSQYEPFEPWFVGMSVSVLALQKHGFDAEHGVEQVIQQAAELDGKSGCGLETLDEQLALLDTMRTEDQAEFLLQSLEESKDVERELNSLFAAWQDGDDGSLIRELDEEFVDYPELAERLIYARNERWAVQVSTLLEQSDDVLVVVGALHLAGNRGLPALLKRRGFKVERH